MVLDVWKCLGVDKRFLNKSAYQAEVRVSRFIDSQICPLADDCNMPNLFDSGVLGDKSWTKYRYHNPDRLLC